jgi:phosphoribosyl-dephospho-CoA transferase
MPADPAPAVHALLRISDPDALMWEAQRPQWTSAALRRAPWVVVRRVAPSPGAWPVGVRGRLRSQRAAAWLPQGAVDQCITPRMLAAGRLWRRRPGITPTPAVAVLDALAAILVDHGHADRWGPGGSVGFELASGVSSTTIRSDLDVVLRADEPVTRDAAARLHADLSKLPVRIDVLLETPQGAAVLAEYAAGTGVTLLRSTEGPRLVRDPWSPDVSTVGAR